MYYVFLVLHLLIALLLGVVVLLLAVACGGKKQEETPTPPGDCPSTEPMMLNESATPPMRPRPQRRSDRLPRPATPSPPKERCCW